MENNIFENVNNIGIYIYIFSICLIYIILNKYNILYKTF